MADALTRREYEILCLLARGLSDTEIAARLHLSPRTVRNHNNHLFSKLGATQRRGARTEAVRIARQLGRLQVQGVTWLTFT